jgi:uncharacterized protein YlxW (UPF0749 family)
MKALVARLRGLSSWQVALGAALLVLGFLVAAQLRSEGPRVRYASNERGPLVETVVGLQAQQDGLKARILDLRDQIQKIETQGQGTSALVATLNAQLRDARIAAGLIALRGSGVVLQLRDSGRTVQPGDNPSDYLVTAHDVRTVLEELWLAGADAAAVNGERITAGTAVLDIGGSILVNSAYLAPPYQVSAIGPADLFDRLSSAAGFREFVKARAEAFGIQIEFATPAQVDLPAYAGAVNLRYARPEPSP